LQKVVKRLNDDKPNVGVVAEKGVEFLVVIFGRVKDYDVVIGCHTTLKKIFVSVLFRFFGLPIGDLRFKRGSPEERFAVDNG
jgi:hypothetical protein